LYGTTLSGGNCGQNMPAKDKKRYAEFTNDKSGEAATGNWGNGKSGGDGGMFSRPRKKAKY
jgi:hypothetical protein